MSSSGLQAKGFFGSLFDFGFTSFVTLKFLKVIYALLVGLILLAGLIFFIAGLVSREPLGILMALVVAPLVTLLYLILARVYMEIIALFFRIGDNTSRIADTVTAGSFAGPITSGWTSGPGPGTPTP